MDVHAVALGEYGDFTDVKISGISSCANSVLVTGYCVNRGRGSVRGGPRG